MEINGVAHVIFRVNRIEPCIAFCDRLLNHVPGTGLLTEGVAFDPAPDHPVSGRGLKD